MVEMKNNGSLVSRFHNKAGYTIELNYKKDLDLFHVSVWSYKRGFLGMHDIYSGYKDDNLVGICLETFDGLLKQIKNKTARRYFLKLVRNLPMHEHKISWFLKNDQVDWDKVRYYENKINGNLYINPKSL